MRHKRVGILVLGTVLFIALALNYAGAQATTPRTGAAEPAEYSFRLEIDGVISAGFAAVSGLESETEVIEYLDPDDDGDGLLLRKRPGRVKYGDITLRRSWDPADQRLEQWRAGTVTGKAGRKSGSIVFLDRDGKETARYNFFEAWPSRHAVRWMAPESLGERGYMVEEIEFVVEKVERAG